MEQTFSDLPAFVGALRRDGQLVEVAAEVDPHLEIAEIHRRVIAAGGPALLFTRAKGSPLSVVSNLFGTAQRVERAFGSRPRRFVERVVALTHELMPPTWSGLWAQRDMGQQLLRLGTRTSRGPVSEIQRGRANLDELPITTSWPEDGGAFLTLPLVYTQHPDDGSQNLGVYRMQRYGPDQMGMHWQIGKGGGFHYAVAEARDEALAVNVQLGGPPALILAAVAPLPENVPELMLASLLAGEKIPLSSTPFGPLPAVASAEIVLVGHVPPRERRPEGPFGDHYGYYSLQHDYPVFHCEGMLRRKNAMLPVTVVGKPRQEDFYIGDFLQELLSPVFPLVMSGVSDLWSYGETGYHSLAAAVVKQRYKREAMVSAFRILGEGQLSLTKFLLVLDRPCDLKNFTATLEHVLERSDFRSDLYVFGNLSMDTLDYTGPRVNEGSKGVLLGVGDPVRQLPREFTGDLPRGIQHAQVFCGGCLVVGGSGPHDDPQALERICQHQAFADWPLLVLVDDVDRTARSPMNFLWTVFTRFEPAADMYARSVDLVRQHVAFTPPVLIDARVKPGFPDELFVDEDTSRKVDQRWSEYFPEGNVAMGDSGLADLD